MSRAPEAASITAREIRALCGDVLDWKVAAIEALRPTSGDIATAVGWSQGMDELGARGRPLEGLAAQVYEILKADEDYGEER